MPGADVVGLLLAACAPTPVGPDTAPPETDPAPAIGVDDVLDLGAVHVGTSATADLAIRNDGDDLLTLGEPLLDDASGQLTVGDLPTLSVLPGDALALPVTFLATVRGDVSGTLLLPSDDPEEPLARIVVVATGAAPVVTVDPSSYDFGAVGQGCVDTRGFDVRNDGDEPLTVSGLDIEGGSGAFALAEGADDTPWVLAPGETRTVSVTFTPERDGAWSGGLVVRSDDPDNPSAGASLDGEGTANARVTDRFVASGRALDIVFAVSGDDPGALEDALADAIPSLTAPLAAANMDFQVAGITRDDGCVENALFVVGSMTDGEQRVAMAGQLAGDGSGDEHTLTLLERALAQLGLGECDEDLVRSRAMLVLVGLTDAAGPAPQASGVYSAEFEAVKPDTDDAAAWALAPDGVACGAVDDAWTDVTSATGGSYLSACDDLATTLATLGEAITQRQGEFPLSRIPWTDTLVVSVDGAWSRDWSYDADANAVVFADGAEPTLGSSVRVDYEAVPLCDGDG